MYENQKAKRTPSREQTLSGELSYASRLEACLSGVWFFFSLWLGELSDVELAPPTAEIMP